MDAIERPTFESDVGKRIYEYVERHGTVERPMLLEVTSASADEFGSELERLKSKGYLEERGGTVELALNVGAVEEYEAGELTVTIRPARNNDFEGIVDAIRDVTDEETYVVAESIAEQLLYEDTVSRHNTVESRVFFVATVDGDIVGWTHLDLPLVEKMRETAQQTVGVRDEFRRVGVGSHLLERGLDWAQANGYRKIYNSIPVVNERAIEFLDDHGWNTEAIRKNHYTIDEDHVDEIILSREL